MFISNYWGLSYGRWYFEDELRKQAQINFFPATVTSTCVNVVSFWYITNINWVVKYCKICKIYGDCTDLDARQDKLFVLLDQWMCHDKISYSKKIVTVAHLIGL